MATCDVEQLMEDGVLFQGVTRRDLQIAMLQLLCEILSVAGSGGGSSPASITTESTTSRTLALSDINTYIRLTNGSSCTITLPVNASVDWASQSTPPVIMFRVAAAGIPTISTSATVNDEKGVIAGLATGDTFALQWVASDVWDVI